MIDTHQHLLYPDRFTYTWTKDIPPLQGAFPLEAYREAAAGTGVEGTVFMEVDVEPAENADEARFFCALADDPANRLLGVIASARPEDEGFEAHLDAITHPRLRGIRRVLHTQPDELSQGTRFRENVSRLGARGLTFDICVLQRQLPLARDLARAAPETTFVLDHCGVPDIAGNDAPTGEGWKQWKRDVTALAELPNLNVKLSGITVYAAEEQRNTEALRPYADVLLETFGPGRMVWGGDWPVCNLGSGLPRWCELTDELLAPLAEDERAKILAWTARRVYGL